MRNLWKQQVRLCGGVERMVELISRSEDKSLAHIQPVLFDSLRYFRLTFVYFCPTSGSAVSRFIQSKQRESFCQWVVRIRCWRWFQLAIGTRSRKSSRFVLIDSPLYDSKRVKFKLLVNLNKMDGQKQLILGGLIIEKSQSVYFEPIVNFESTGSFCLKYERYQSRRSERLKLNALGNWTFLWTIKKTKTARSQWSLLDRLNRVFHFEAIRPSTFSERWVLVF